MKKVVYKSIDGGNASSSSEQNEPDRYYGSERLFRSIGLFIIAAFASLVVAFSSNRVKNLYKTGHIQGIKHLQFRRIADKDDEMIYEFKLLQLTDLHFGEAPNTDWGPMQDKKSATVIRKYIADENPDLIILSGDQLTANDIDANATAYYRELIEIIIAAKSDAKWCMIFGNHDDMPLERRNEDGDIMRFLPKTSRDELLTVDMSYEGSFTKKGPSHVFGKSNYVLPIFTGKDAAINIHFLDSGGGNLTEKIDLSQLEWLKSEYKESQLVGVAFQHIPSSFMDFQYSEACSGLNEDSITPLDSDPGILKYLSEHQVQFLAVGHDHGNGYCCPSKNHFIHVCFGRHSGYGGYSKKKWTKGARVYNLKVIDKQLSWNSWVRLETGEMVDEYLIKM